MLAVNNSMEIRVLSPNDGDSVNIDLLNELNQKKIVYLDHNGQLIGIYKNPYTHNQARKLYSPDLLQKVIENRKPKEDKEDLTIQNNELLYRFQKWCSE
jgi:hypothetical protein